MGIAIYANAQRNARDGVRRGEISSFGKSIESTKDPTAANYTFTAANFTTDYPQNPQRDPLRIATEAWYCIATNASAVPGLPTAWATGVNCPTAPLGYSALVDNTGTYITAGNALAGAGGARFWRICARLEVPAANNWHCVTNSQ